MSCNFLGPRGVVDNARNSDTLSEVSETGTTTSGWTSGWDSREELRDFATKIGLKDVSDLHQDRFRVNRKKLEQMLSGDNDAPLPADVFFEQIMADTDTYITWPSKLKIGAKSKKDPHVRIAGRPEDVQAAKERITSVLDTRCNRVTMKMDVSYTDHSHIIGKEGLSIKRVMEETQCHVHFPDSNRSNPTEKSNQVSISGNIEDIECARGRVRELIPLIFGFELPIMSRNIDANCPYVTQVQEQYKVQVMFKTRPKLHATLVLVKGVEWEVDQVKQATMLLMDFMCENLASQTPVQMTMEISPHHHPVVLGKNHSNLKAIMQYTGCQIMFPDAQDPYIPSLKKSNVNITGSIHSVYKARQLLMGSLPILIIFDLPEDNMNLRTRPEQIADIQSSLDVTINIRQKAKLNTRACVIKGIERSVVNVYKARNMILGIESANVSANIPPSYHMPQPTGPAPISVEIPPQMALNPPGLSPLLSPLVSPNWQHLSNFGQAPPFVGMMQQPQFMYNTMHSLGSSGYHSSLGRVSNGSMEHSRESSTYSSISSINTNPSPMGSPNRNISPNYPKNEASTATETKPVKSELSSALMEMNSCGGYHGPSVDKRQDRTALTPSDYEQKRIAAMKAMQSRSAGYRVPTNVWAGYGVSHTSPAGIGKDDQTAVKKEEEVWKSPSSKDEMPSTSGIGLNTSNYLEHTPSNEINKIINLNWQDVPSMLASLGLAKYVGVFMANEIDLTIFPTLSDQDLIDIGVNALGARRKILLVISEFRNRASPFAVAPGAERKNSSSLSSTSSPKENW